MADIDVKFAEIEQRCKSNTKRIDKIEEEQDALRSIATSVAVMANEQKNISTKVDTIDTKVSALEGKPGKRWESVVEKVIMVIVGAVIAFLLAKAGIV